MLSEKELKKKGRGHSDEHISTDKSIVVTPWFDKRVLVSSNFIGQEPNTQCRRFDKKEKDYIMIDRPATVTIYNKFMGGVDKADMLLSLYRTKYRCRKWYQQIVCHVWSQAVVTWFIHKELADVPYTYI